MWTLSSHNTWEELIVESDTYQHFHPNTHTALCTLGTNLWLNVAQFLARKFILVQWNLQSERSCEAQEAGSRSASFPGTVGGMEPGSGACRTYSRDHLNNKRHMWVEVLCVLALARGIGKSAVVSETSSSFEIYFTLTRMLRHTGPLPTITSSTRS